MAVVAFVNDAFAIRKILDHLGLTATEAEKPPPLREVLRVAEHGLGWGLKGVLQRSARWSVTKAIVLMRWPQRVQPWGSTW